MELNIESLVLLTEHCLIMGLILIIFEILGWSWQYFCVGASGTLVLIYRLNKFSSQNRGETNKVVRK